jgi:hypothetical protein
MAPVQTDTPILLEALMQRSRDTAEDVYEHLKLSPSVAAFLVDFTPMPALEPKALKVFPAGTPVREVDVVDRGQKMVFTCEQHPDTAVYVSKYPPSSRWFKADTAPECPCSTLDPVWVLVKDYKPTRND